MPKIFSLFINSFSSLKLDYHPAIVQRRHAQRQLQAYEEAIADYNFVLELEPENLVLIIIAV